MAVEMKLKAKYTVGGTAKKGAAKGGGDSSRRRPNYRKASDAQKKAIAATQEKRYKVVFFNPNPSSRIIKESELASFMAKLAEADQHGDVQA